MRPQLANAPLCMTLVQVRFNPVTDIGAYIPKIQDRFRKMKFDSFSEGILPRLVVGNELNQFQFKTESSYTMGVFSGHESFVLGSEHLSFQVSDYSTYQLFKDTFLEGLKIVDEEVTLSTTVRIGLRYVNAVSATDFDELAVMVDPSVFGIAVPEAARSYNYSECMCESDGNQMLLRSMVKDGQFQLPSDLAQGAPNLSHKFKELNALHAMLDFDVFYDKLSEFSMSALSQKLDELHKMAEIAFDSATTEDARKAWA